jgi:hypothetical protein
MSASRHWRSTAPQPLIKEQALLAASSALCEPVSQACTSKAAATTLAASAFTESCPEQANRNTARKPVFPDGNSKARHAPKTRAAPTASDAVEERANLSMMPCEASTV